MEVAMDKNIKKYICLCSNKTVQKQADCLQVAGCPALDYTEIKLPKSQWLKNKALLFTHDEWVIGFQEFRIMENHMFPRSLRQKTETWQIRHWLLKLPPGSDNNLTLISLAKASHMTTPNLMRSKKYKYKPTKCPKRWWSRYIWWYEY